MKCVFPGLYEYRNISLSYDNIPEDVDVITLIITRWNSFDERAALRDMFGSNNTSKILDYKVIFLFNWSSDISEEDLGKIERESDEFQDVLIPKVEDNYHNVGLKLLSSFNWINGIQDDLTKLKWIIKLDDDVIVNITMLDEYLRSNETFQNAIHCHLSNWPDPIRRYDSKW